ncbi:hypothetical protein SAMN05518672_101853 [Chitinophaga sp. CF118]|nr:hypothetical protein SAMN05518672_101853 [Chitinophaga sp. CF118]
MDKGAINRAFVHLVTSIGQFSNRFYEGLKALMS